MKKVKYKKKNSNKAKEMRLNVFIANYSTYSRREADHLIKEKKVSVNGHFIHQPSTKVNVSNDCVKITGKIIRPVKNFIYIAFHKPTKTLTTTSDPKNRPTVFHYFKKIKHRIFSVGRLDWNTEGLLLLTNDGYFSKKVSQPKNKIAKTYLAKLDGIPKSSQLEKLKRGVSIPAGGRVKALDIKKMASSWIRITIQEGKNKQIHYMFRKIGFSVKRLKRISIGQLKLGSLKSGQAKHLTKKELARIFQSYPHHKPSRFKKHSTEY